MITPGFYNNNQAIVTEVEDDLFAQFILDIEAFITKYKANIAKMMLSLLCLLITLLYNNNTSDDIKYCITLSIIISSSIYVALYCLSKCYTCDEDLTIILPDDDINLSSHYYLTDASGNII